MSEWTAPIGGAFLVEETPLEQVLIPEELGAEARLMAKTMEDFLRKEVLPVNARLEAKEPGLMRSLLQQAGSLGLLAGGLPERYGGLDLPKSALALLAEKAALNLSFAISAGVHAGVATLPLLYFGTPEQKASYLPRLASGEILGAFALSEANSGSDALGAQTKATLSPDGKYYRLDGTKLWTTNGGFADLFTVFAKVDGARFTAFLVERETPGLHVEREEHKLGLHGSSTCRIVLQDARVPKENVLGEVGKGHLCALHALNLGRFNIGVTALGAAKEWLKIATLYAKQRTQFGQPIANFGLIRHKLAEMAIRLYALESMAYRIAGALDAAFENAAETEDSERLRAASAEYAIECALLKFVGTETMAYVADEALQIHGGYGFSEEFPIAQAYRDARVFRIFEGTNEINRLAAIDQLLRRLQKGRLNLSTPPTTANASDEIGKWIPSLRQAMLYTLEQASSTLGETLMENQEVAASLAEILAALFASESAWLRFRKLPAGNSATLTYTAATILITDATTHTERQARTLLATLPSDPEALRRLLPIPTLDTITLRREIADAVLARDGYPF